MRQWSVRTWQSWHFLQENEIPLNCHLEKVKHIHIHIHFSTLQFPSIVKGHNEPISIINNNNKCWCPFNLIWVQSLDTLFSIHLNIQLIKKCFILLKVFFLLFCDVSGSLFCGCVWLNTLQQWKPNQLNCIEKITHQNRDFYKIEK